MAVATGKPPAAFTDIHASLVWDDVDLAIGVEWSQWKKAMCPGCGRPLSQHEYNADLGREETSDDYSLYVAKCPAKKAVSEGQYEWQNIHRRDLKLFHEQKGPDPSAGLFWVPVEKLKERRGQ